MDAEAEIISERINKYTIDDFLLNELFDNGDGLETLKRFLKFKLTLNFIDSKTVEADKRFLDDNYRKVISDNSDKSAKIGSSISSNNSRNSKKFPSYDDDL